VSASSFIDWCITCDGCGLIVWASQWINALDNSATALRKILRKRGWLVSLPKSEDHFEVRHVGSRLDYCPGCAEKLRAGGHL
jgi:hypothetical protein